ncbi:MAG: hypothetical protein KDB71_01300 [Mycobacterium sp.]|nr:hypothetical protein [Mycobacterium sp.]
MLRPHPASPTPLSRRRILTEGSRGLLALALFGASVSATATGCGKGGPPEPDPLEAELGAARRDSELAAAAAKTAPRPLVPALLVVADERAQHAAALAEELARAAGEPAPTEPAGSETPTPTASPAASPSVPDVMKALRGSAESATKLAATLSGYRAGLMGSIAAACTASYKVGLTPLPKKGTP